MEQIFIANTKGLSYKDFDRELFRIRKVIEGEVTSVTAQRAVSSKTVTYKGQLTHEQVMTYFKGLQELNFASHLHSSRTLAFLD